MKEEKLEIQWFDLYVFHINTGRSIYTRKMPSNLQEVLNFTIDFTFIEHKYTKYKC